MKGGISPGLKQRLEKIAQQQACSLETLLSDYATQLEQQSAPHHSLHSSEQFYRGLIESQIDFVCRYTPDTRLTYVNPAYCQYFERQAEELIGVSFLTLTPNIDEDAVFARIQEVLQNPTPDVRIFSSLDAQGRKKWVQWVDYGISDASGTVREIQAIGRDVTTLMELQERLHQREEMLSTLFKSVPALLVHLGKQSEFQDVNDYWHQILGWTAKQIQAHPDFWSELYPDTAYRQQVVHFIQNCEGEWQDFQTVRQDGTMLDISWSSVQLSDGYRLAIGLDVTQRKRAESVLKLSEEKYRQLVEASHDLIWSVDVAGRITFINQAARWIYGLAPEEMIGQLHTDFVPDEQLEANLASWQQAIDNQDRLHNFENWVQDKNGRKVLLNTNAVLTRDEQRQITGSMGISQDITHRLELENQRVYANKLEVELEKEQALIKMKDHFISLISHEFRTPLAVMNTSIDLVTRYFNRLSAEQILKKLEVVQQQIQRMVHLMEDALRFSKANARKTEFSPENVDVFALCQGLIEVHQLTDNGAHQMILIGNKGIVRADPKLLEHIVSNLLANALKYSPPNTTVTLKVQQRSYDWLFTVSDEGIGIPADDLPRLFEPFHRADNVRTLQGTGLGLTLVKEYVAVHGGTVTVESTLNAGTTFSFTLPVYEENEEAL